MKEENYDSEARFSDAMLPQMEHSNEVFQVPEGYFDAQQIRLESALNTPFEAPPGYFEEQAAKLEQEMHAMPQKGRNGRTVRIWLSVAAAAVLAGVCVLVVAEKEEPVTFSQQLEQSQLEFEDLEEIEFDESVYDEFIVEDTLAPDTVSTKKLPKSINDFKPSKGQSVISWDDIDADDIEEYLKDEESLQVIDEL
jgi:hypothetical protein